MTESMREGVTKMCSEFLYSVYVHTKLAASSDHNNLQYPCNDDPNCYYIIPTVNTDNSTYRKTLCRLDPFKKLA